MKNTKIAWAHHTVNFWWGCVKVSAACAHCYAELMAKLFSRGKATWGPTGARWVRHEAARRELYALDRAAHESGVRERVFINSMSDTFEARADLDEARGFLWDACRFTTNLDLLLLTKRPENVREMVPLAWLQEWPAHVWIGTTVEDQATANTRVPVLLDVPAAIRFLSCEPLLEAVDLTRMDKTSDSDPGYNALHLGSDDEGDLRAEINWVIVGGESGPKARPMHPAWARSLRDQCAAAGVPFFFKQWGEWAPYCTREEYTEKKPLRCMKPNGEFSFWSGNEDTTTNYSENYAETDQPIERFGKEAAGRMLDGIEHNAVPTAGTG